MMSLIVAAPALIAMDYSKEVWTTICTIPELYAPFQSCMPHTIPVRHFPTQDCRMSPPTRHVSSQQPISKFLVLFNVINHHSIFITTESKACFYTFGTLSLIPHHNHWSIKEGTPKLSRNRKRQAKCKSCDPNYQPLRSSRECRAALTLSPEGIDVRVHYCRLGRSLNANYCTCRVRSFPPPSPDHDTSQGLMRRIGASSRRAWFYNRRS